jgi:hypothetical protein
VERDPPSRPAGACARVPFLNPSRSGNILIKSPETSRLLKCGSPSYASTSTMSMGAVALLAAPWIFTPRTTNFNPLPSLTSTGMVIRILSSTDLFGWDKPNGPDVYLGRGVVVDLRADRRDPAIVVSRSLCSHWGCR